MVNLTSLYLTAANSNSSEYTLVQQFNSYTTGTVSASAWNASTATGNVDLTVVTQTGVAAATDVSITVEQETTRLHLALSHRMYLSQAVTETIFLFQLLLTMLTLLLAVLAQIHCQLHTPRLQL